MMEKYGVEKEEKPKGSVQEKVAALKCTHPPDKVRTDGDVKFCDACNKYLEGVGK